MFWLFTFALVAPGVNMASAAFEIGTENTAGMAVWWDTSSGAWGWLIGVIKSAINWALWMLSLIVLVLLLRGGFQMVTAAGDETKYKAWFKILKQAAMWLAFIAISWFLVSIIFWLLSSLTSNNEWTGTVPAAGGTSYNHTITHTLA